ncbi:MAG: hypothetical protein AMXMBFR64_22600 [Myxococcales bacterium]
MERFTALGGPAVEARIASDLDVCIRGIRDALRPLPIRGVVIGGGLGRGEGGIRREGGEELPYNDYDLFVVVDAPSLLLSMVRPRVNRLAAALTTSLNVEVEIGVLRPTDLAAAPPTLMMTDLRAGHRVLVGPPDLLSAMPAGRPLAPVEASRLLLNRGALLVMARQLVDGGPLGPQEWERVARYVRKSVLARGDSWLMLRGRYLTGAQACAERLAAEGPPDLADAYGRAVRERLGGIEAPGDPGESLRAEAEALVGAFGAAESARLGGSWPPFRTYGRTVLAAEGASPARERLRVARHAGPGALVGGRPWARCAALLPWVLAGEATGIAPGCALGPARTQGDAVRWLALWRASA